MLRKLRCLTEYSEKRIITLFVLFENEIGPGVLQLTVQRNTLQENQRDKKLATENVSILPLLFAILTGYMFVESWTRSLQVQPRF